MVQLGGLIKSLLSPSFFLNPGRAITKYIDKIVFGLDKGLSVAYKTNHWKTLNLMKFSELQVQE